MQDEIIDTVLARRVHADACRQHPLVGWIIMHDTPDYLGKFIARLATGDYCPYVLVGDTLDEVRTALPPCLERSPRQPADLPEVVEVWFSR